MEHEIEQLQHAKMFMDYLANGVDPVSNTECGFKAPAELCKKRLTAAQITALLTKGRTGVIKGFRSKAGKPFSAALYIDQSDRTVKFDFQNNT